MPDLGVERSESHQAHGCPRWDWKCFLCLKTLRGRKWRELNSLDTKCRFCSITCKLVWEANQDG